MTIWYGKRLFDTSTAALWNSLPNKTKCVTDGIQFKRLIQTAPDVRECLKTIKLGKAAGLDGLAAEHFVFSHSMICVHLSLLFTGMLIHGFLPASLMKSATVPILKNR